jgi:hypothetical protein
MINVPLRTKIGDVLLGPPPVGRIVSLYAIRDDELATGYNLNAERAVSYQACKGRVGNTTDLL